MDDRQVQELIAKAQIGGDIREWVKHPGFAILKKFIEAKVQDARNEWLSAPSAQAAEEIRLKAKPFAEIENFLKKVIIEGDVAAEKLRDLQ